MGVASACFASNHSDVELVIAATIYLTFCAFLILPHLGAPPIFERMAIGLCGSEFVAALGWSFTRDDETFFTSIAAVQIPVLAAALFVVATAYAVFVARRW